MDKMKILQAITLIMLLVFFGIFMAVSKTDCEKCSFDFKGEKISVNELLEIQEQECFKKSLELNFSDYVVWEDYSR